jgi:alkanesulfonate monooxygenase SsuD/methylene tetrahydromethanopterin reductase-like flavin-dependent oxidoreductase (luciferase family)
LLAKQVATLDDVCGGRLLFGIGGGWNPEECSILPTYGALYATGRIV